MDRELYDRGLARRREVLGDAYVDRALDHLNDFNRDFQRLATEYCWGRFGPMRPCHLASIVSSLSA
jgi:4-carboxymuconolactone decarboxylase